MPELFYVAAYGPMHARGVWTAYLVGETEEVARRIAGELAPKGYDLERVHLQADAPAPLLRDSLILNSPLTVGAWWDARQAELKPEIPAAGQARLF
jgi:hypothetical protein